MKSRDMVSMTYRQMDVCLMTRKGSMVMKRAATKGHPSELEALQEKGKGLTEYGMLLGLVVLCFFVFIRTVNLEQTVANIFLRVDNAIMQLVKSNGDARGAQ